MKSRFAVFSLGLMALSANATDFNVVSMMMYSLPIWR